jgi:methyl-CpG-binding domain protein 4
MPREILIQENYTDDPWKILICCILLNQTNNRQVRPILDSVFDLIPNIDSAINCDPESLAAIIKTTGFYNIKSRRIIEMSKAYKEGFTRVTELPGVGIYANESWEIFVNGNLDIKPTDGKLRAYLDAVLF